MLELRVAVRPYSPRTLPLESSIRRGIMLRLLLSERDEALS